MWERSLCFDILVACSTAESACLAEAAEARACVRGFIRLNEKRGET